MKSLRSTFCLGNRSKIFRQSRTELALALHLHVWYPALTAAYLFCNYGASLQVQRQIDSNPLVAELTRLRRPTTGDHYIDSPSQKTVQQSLVRESF
jgi:hypothetical protein